MTETDDIRDLADKLEQFASVEGSELGETCTALARLAHCADYISDELRHALEEEIAGQLNWFETHFKIASVTRALQIVTIELTPIDDVPT